MLCRTNWSRTDGIWTEQQFDVLWKRDCDGYCRHRIRMKCFDGIICLTRYCCFAPLQEPQRYEIGIFYPTLRHFSLSLTKMMGKFPERMAMMLQTIHDIVPIDALVLFNTNFYLNSKHIRTINTASSRFRAKLNMEDVRWTAPHWDTFKMLPNITIISSAIHAMKRFNFSISRCRQSTKQCRDLICNSKIIFIFVTSCLY